MPLIFAISLLRSDLESTSAIHAFYLACIQQCTDLWWFLSPPAIRFNSAIDAYIITSHLPAYDNTILASGAIVVGSDIEVITNATLSRFSEVAWANSQRIHRAWLISPWIGTSQGRGDPLSHVAEALARCAHFWVLTRSPSQLWHQNALNILKTNTNPSILYNNDLHAKLYILDCDGFRYALLGSPNLTARANMVNRELAIELRTTAQSRDDRIADVIEELISYANMLLEDPGSRLQ